MVQGIRRERLLIDCPKSLTARLNALKIDPNSALEDDLQEDDKATFKENEELIDKERRGRQNSSEYLIP